MWHLIKNFISLLKQKFPLPNKCMLLHTYLSQWFTEFQWILQACKWALKTQTLSLKKTLQHPNGKELWWQTRKPIMLIHFSTQTLSTKNCSRSWAPLFSSAFHQFHMQNESLRFLLLQINHCEIWIFMSYFCEAEMNKLTA